MPVDPQLAEVLAVRGSLSFTVAGPRGATAGTVTGDGATVRVRADDPAAAWDAALGSIGAGPALLRTAAALLHDSGVTVEVSGPVGLVAAVGSTVDSQVGALLTGTRRVRLGGPAALRPLAVAQVRRSLAGLPPDAVALGVAALLLWALGGQRTGRTRR